MSQRQNSLYKRPIGFSTGSLALSQYNTALNLLSNTKADAVELSALREHELEPLINDLGHLDLKTYEHVSFHAPSKLEKYNESEFISILSNIELPIIIHADIIQTVSKWRKLGKKLCVENMDKRKRTGRTVKELEPLLKALPSARLCLDLGHARQVDPSMCEAVSLLTEFGNRVGQIHLSELNAESKHEPLSYASVIAINSIARLVPSNTPIILEFKVKADELDKQIDFTRKLFKQNSVDIRSVV